MDKPLPEMSPEAEPFWRACREGRLLLPRCRACETVFFYPRPACPACWSEELDWIESAGRGSIWSFSEVHVSFGGDAWKDELPYTVVIIELDEGVRLVSRLVDAPADEVEVGARVRVTFGAHTPEVTLPYFHLDEATSS